MNVSSCSKSATPILSYAEHQHSEWEIILVLTGSMRTPAGGTVYELTEGDVLALPPGVPHSGRAGGPYTDLYVQAKSLDFPGPVQIRDYDGSIRALLLMLHKVLTEKENNYAPIADCLLETVCQYIKKLAEKGFSHLFVSELKNRIYDNLANPDFCMKEAFAQMGYNADYFRRCFRAELGQTPLAYMTGLRIAQAKKLLLQETFVSVEDVSARCGFRDSFYFSKCFKKHAGLSPQQYRKEKLSARERD